MWSEVWPGDLDAGAANLGTYRVVAAYGLRLTGRHNLDFCGLLGKGRHYADAEKPFEASNKPLFVRSRVSIVKLPLFIHGDQSFAEPIDDCLDLDPRKSFHVLYNLSESIEELRKSASPVAAASANG